MTRTLNYKERKPGSVLVFHGTLPTVLSSFVWQVSSSNIEILLRQALWLDKLCIFFAPSKDIGDAQFLNILKQT